MDERKKLVINVKRDCDKYLAQKILKDITSWKTVELIKNSYFNKLELIDYSRIYTKFILLLNQDTQQNLLNLTLLSRSSKKIDLACSNAITILARSDFSFNGIDLSNIRIPKADLSQCLFINVNFENSNLSEVKFMQSQLYKVNFKNCDLSNAKFGLVMEINSENGKILSFSYNNDYFYYRTDDSLKEINLRSLEVKNKAGFYEYISSNIAKIHSENIKKCTSRVYDQYIGFYDYERTLIFNINTLKLEFSPNWKFIAAHDDKSFVRCWDIEKNQQTLGFSKDNTYKWGNLAFSPCSRFLAIKNSAIINIIETENWTHIRSVWCKFSAKCPFAISNCGRKIVYSEFGSLYLLDTISSNQTKIYFRYKKIRSISFSPCGKFLAFGLHEGAGYVMDLETQIISQIFAGFESGVISVLFSASSKYISWATSKGNIRIYNFFPKLAKSDSNQHLQILNAKVSSKGTYLITSSIEKSVLWSLSNFKPKQLKQIIINNHFTEYAFSPLETYLIQRFHTNFNIYDISNDLWLKTLICDNIYTFTFSHCENYFIISKQYGYEYFRVPYLDLARKLDKIHQSFNHIAFSGCGKYHIFYDSQYMLYIWDLEKNYYINKIQIEHGPFMFALTPNLSEFAFLVIKKWKNYIRVLSIKTGESACIKNNEEISGLCYSSNGKALIRANGDGINNIWSIEDKKFNGTYISLAVKAGSVIEIWRIEYKPELIIFKRDYK